MIRRVVYSLMMALALCAAWGTVARADDVTITSPTSMTVEANQDVTVTWKMNTGDSNAMVVVYKDGEEFVNHERKAINVAGTRIAGNPGTLKIPAKYVTAGSKFEISIWPDHGNEKVVKVVVKDNDFASGGSSGGPKSGARKREVAGALEISRYYMRDLENAAKALGAGEYEFVYYSEMPEQYFNDFLTLAGVDKVEKVTVSGRGYTVYGVSVGMDSDTAERTMRQAGMSYLEWDPRTNRMAFEHPSDEDSVWSASSGFDSVIYLEIQDGEVSKIDWNGYTG